MMTMKPDSVNRNEAKRDKLIAQRERESLKLEKADRAVKRGVQAMIKLDQQIRRIEKKIAAEQAVIAEQRAIERQRKRAADAERSVEARAKKTGDKHAIDKVGSPAA
jgi:hypothetical protein